MPTGLQRVYGRGHLHFISDPKKEAEGYPYMKRGNTFSCYCRLPLLKTVRLAIFL
jgi:hypothetical protein